MLQRPTQMQDYRKGKGKEAKLCFMGHELRENRHGLLVHAYVTEASGYAERVAALTMIEPLHRADTSHHAGCRQGL